MLLKSIEKLYIKKSILSCHEKWWFPVGKIKQYWDEVVFLHDQHRDYHKEYTGDFVIIPNLKENLNVSDKTNVKKNEPIRKNQTQVEITKHKISEFIYGRPITIPPGPHSDEEPETYEQKSYQILFIF